MSAPAPPMRSATETNPVALVALVSITVSAGAVVYTDVRCLCNRRIMAVPGAVRVEVRKVATDAERSGRGRVVSCKRCSALLEVIEHG